MKALISFFQGLRGKLILTYTLVTVLALLALELVFLLGIGFLSSYSSIDQRAYLQDVVYNLFPQASGYLQPGREDLPGLQAWLDEVYASGYASLQPQYVFDSPAARIAKEDPIFVLSPDAIVLAQSPREENNLIGRSYRPPEYARTQAILENALARDFNSLHLNLLNPEGNYLLAVPVTQAGTDSGLVGVVVLTVQPPPPFLAIFGPNLSRVLPAFMGVLLATGLVLLAGVAPFGALFGFIMSRGLTRRLRALSAATDAWSRGDFRPLPPDRSKDEIGSLGRRMWYMAEQLQSLLQSQQELASLEERNRLARELHDTVKQQAFATLMQVRAARNLLPGEADEARQRLEEAENLIKTTQGELGRLIAELRPAALEGQGLTGALQNYLQTWSQHTRIPAQFQARNERLLPLEVEQGLFRVAQEALANVARHSRASAATVRLDYSPKEVSLTVADNGVGFDLHPNGGSGYGLQTMRERAAALGGRLEMQSSPENGTILVVTAPAG